MKQILTLAMSSCELRHIDLSEDPHCLLENLLLGWFFLLTVSLAFKELSTCVQLYP